MGIIKTKYQTCGHTRTRGTLTTISWFLSIIWNYMYLNLLKQILPQLTDRSKLYDHMTLSSDSINIYSYLKKILRLLLISYAADLKEIVTELPVVVCRLSSYKHKD